ncbi:hypothetical protein vseg_021281 [Gypsophila vaccaria]
MKWGLSKLILLKSGFHLTAFMMMRNMGMQTVAIPFLYASIISLFVSVASHPSINLPILLGKTSDGRLPIWSTLMFSPFLLFVWAFSLLRRYCIPEPPFSEVIDGVFVGGWPFSPRTCPPGTPAIIDCTCEFPRVSLFTNNAYLCLPTWDTRSPQPADLESAVKWACRKRALRVPVFVHCAYGHGRSVAVTCALLVALGAVDNWKDAEKLIKTKRPFISMNSLHRQSLEEWSKHRLSPLKRNS